MATTKYLRLFPAVKQFELKNGALNVGGRLFVYYEGTDDLAEIYDENGSRLQQPAILDNDGRALGLFVDASKVYRLEVQDAFGAMQFTVRKMAPSGGGAGSSIGNQYDVISSDGSITVDKYDDGGVTKFDLGIGPNDSDEFLEWIKCSEEDCGSTWIPAYQSGTMETDVHGIKVHKGHLYHFTNSFTVDPNGSGINYDTFRVTMYCGDNVVDERDFDIDSSLNDTVLCEFSRDVVPSEDTHVYFKLSIPATCKASGEVQCHRIYSGINAVPDTCATKQWIAGSYQPLSGMSAYVHYSAVGNNTVGQVTGINGSAIVGGLDSASVSSIASSVASSYTESAFSSISSWTADFSSISSKADSSSLSAYQPVSAMSGYATEAYVDDKVVDKLDATASSLFLTGLPDDLATTGDVASAVSGKLDKSASGEFYPMTGNPSGFLTAHQSLAGLATVEYVDSSVSSKLDTSAFASASGNFQPTGDYAYNSSLSAYYPASASGAFQPSGQYQTAGDYAFNSAVSAKLDASASGNFVVNSAMTSWIPYSALDYSGTAISGIGGSPLAGMGGGADYTGIYPVNVDNTAREISVDSLPLVTDSSMTAYGSAGSSVIGVNMDILSSKQDTLSFAYNTADQISSINGSALGGMDEAAVSGIASAYAQSAASGKLDASASSSFYSTANESGFITGVDLSPYQPTSAMSGYIPTSMSSDFQQVTGMSSYALSSDISATVDLVGTQSANWGGSALQLSAGPGVKLEKSGNVLVASTDETVLWSSSGYSVGDTMQTYNLSGNPSDFEEIQVYGQRPLGATDTMGAFDFRFQPAYLNANFVSKICVPLAFVAGGSVTPYIGGYSVIDINTTSWHDGFTWQYQPTTTYQGTSYIAHIHKIVGINRTAGF